MSATRDRQPATSDQRPSSSGTTTSTPAAARSTGTSNQHSATSTGLSEPISLRPGEDQEREAALRRMKAWATGLLVLATVIFVIASEAIIKKTSRKKIVSIIGTISIRARFISRRGSLTGGALRPAAASPARSEAGSRAARSRQ